MISKIIYYYKFLEKLGEGSMGLVFETEDAKLKRTVDLRFLTPQALLFKEQKTQFVQEERVAIIRKDCNAIIRTTDKYYPNFGVRS